MLVAQPDVDLPRTRYVSRVPRASSAGPLSIRLASYAGGYSGRSSRIVVPTTLMSGSRTASRAVAYTMSRSRQSLQRQPFRVVLAVFLQVMLAGGIEFVHDRGGRDNGPRTENGRKRAIDGAITCSHSSRLRFSGCRPLNASPCMP